MKQLPEGWKREILWAALEEAGYRYEEREGRAGMPIFSFNYGPEAGPSFWMTVQVTPGAMVFVAHDVVPCPDPTLEQLRAANQVNIDWGAGRFRYDAQRGSFSAAITLFAYPDWAPPGPAVQWACHQLWKASGALGAFRTPTVDAPPERLLPRDLAATFAQRTGIQFSERAGLFHARLDAGPESADLQFGERAPGLLVFDASPLAAGRCPLTKPGLLELNALSNKLLRFVAVVWPEGQLMARDPLPTPFVTPHAEWPGLMFDHALGACGLLARTFRG